jgi:ABC-type transport system involved in cytochrome bd biosynthesis fused ATPase/permease subunit
LAANLAYGGEGLDKRRVARAIADADLASVAEDLARRHGGADEALGEGGGLLSGGEGQRVRLARALLRPGVRLALLDEAFRGLDRQQRHHLLTQARDRWADATLLFVTHDVAETDDFDRVLVVDGGTVVEDGDPRVLAADPTSAYRALLDDETSARHALDNAWRRLDVEVGRVCERPLEQRRSPR